MSDDRMRKVEMKTRGDLRETSVYAAPISSSSLTYSYITMVLKTDTSTEYWDDYRDFASISR